MSAPAPVPTTAPATTAPVAGAPATPESILDSRWYRNKVQYQIKWVDHDESDDMLWRPTDDFHGCGVKDWCYNCPKSS
ncbi:hypothetical protein BC828DRAFT_414683 [Blastocladiella britannica]|nr:hypothetical protein BC828DRAFT_414683 [Blastocladiella britannica]